VCESIRDAESHFCSHKFLLADEIALETRGDDVSIYARTAATIAMRVTITKRPYCTINGMHFRTWRVGETYDVSVEIATLLIVEGCAQLEMRAGSDRRRAKRWGDMDRRHERVG
jgi:hypothetical protein